MVPDMAVELGMVVELVLLPVVEMGMVLVVELVQDMVLVLEFLHAVVLGMELDMAVVQDKVVKPAFVVEPEYLLAVELALQ